MKVAFKQCLIALALMGFATSAFGEDYPNKPVKIVVGYVPGGGPDFIARILSQKLAQILGQPFIVENKPGASGTMATTLVARAPADGYILLLGETGQLVLAPHIIKGLPYDPIKDFTPVGQVGGGAGMAIVANAKTSIKTLQDLIREAKANPGKISYGSTGIGGIHHVAMEAFKASAGVDLLHIPYKGGGLSIQAVLSGEVPIVMTGLSAVWPSIRAGTVVLLAVTSASRLDPRPNVPVLTEIYKDMDAFDSDTGILGPAGLPPEVLAKLSKAIKQATESPDFVASFKKIGQSILFSTPEGYGETIRRNLKRYEQLVKITNIKG